MRVPLMSTLSNVQVVFADPFFPRLTQGIAQACNDADHTFSLFLLHTEGEEKPFDYGYQFDIKMHGTRR